ncbi:MAG: hypothetical protein RID81_18765 [Sandaracinaceae bacterium]
MSGDKKERARARRIDTGRELERLGHVDHAVKEYLRAKVPSEAARVLAAKGRLREAGQALLDGLKVTDLDVAGLAASDRELLGQAVVFFRQGNDAAQADALEGALAATGPPPADATPRALGLPSPAPSSRPAPERPSAAPQPKSLSTNPRPSSSSPPAVPSKLEVPRISHAPKGSFRPPAGASGSFRAPSRAPSGSFRPPMGGEKPSRPPEAVRAPRAAPLPREAAALAPPGAASERTPPRESARVSRPAPAPSASRPAPSTPAPSSPAPEARAQRTPAPSAPEPREPVATPKAAGHTLSASGEAVTEYAGSRATGWRDAGSEDLDRSIQEHLEAGRKGAAARIARDAGRYEQALEWFRELDLHMQAGACLRALDRTEEALAELLREDPAGTAYRKCCFELIPVASELDRLDFDIDRYLTAFVDEGPRDRDEIPTYLQLAALFERTKFPRGAIRCLTKVLEAHPDHEETRERLKALERGDAPKETRSRGASATVRGLPPLPTLDELRALAREHAPSD